MITNIENVHIQVIKLSNVLSKFTILCWAACIAIWGHMWPVGRTRLCYTVFKDRHCQITFLKKVLEIHISSKSLMSVSLSLSLSPPTMAGTWSSKNTGPIHNIKHLFTGRAAYHFRSALSCEITKGKLWSWEWRQVECMPHGPPLRRMIISLELWGSENSWPESSRRQGARGRRMGKATRLRRHHILQGGQTNGQWARKRMLSIIGHRGGQWNHNMKPLPTHQEGCDPKGRWQPVSLTVWRNGSSRRLLVGRRNSAVTLESSLAISQNS